MRLYLSALAASLSLMASSRAAAEPVVYEFSGVPELGVLELDFHAPITSSPQIFDLSGAIQIPTSDSDVMTASFEHPSLGFLPNTDAVEDPGYVGLYLRGPGLISGGQIRPGLTAADLSRAYLYTIYSSATAYGIYVGNGGSCPLDLTVTECAQGGYVHYWDEWTHYYEITELHPVPEASGPGLIALTVLALLASGACAPRSPSTRVAAR